MQCATDIRLVINLRVLNRWASARASSQMHDRLKFFAMKHVPHRRAVAKIDMVNRQVFSNGSNVRVLDLRIVKIIEVVEDGDFVASRQELLDKMRPNKTSAARDENSHGSSLATDAHRSTQISG